MKNNIFTDKREIERGSSSFSNKYENLRYDNSPSPKYLNGKMELGTRKKGDPLLKTKNVEESDLDHFE